MRVKSRASDAECPEALPVSVLHALAISQLVDEWLANYRTASIVDSSEVRERPSVCRSRKKKDFANVEKSGFVKFLKEMH